MLKLACNYYPEVEELLKEERITVEYFKYPGIGYQMEIFRKQDLSDYEKCMERLNGIRPTMMHGLGFRPHNVGSKTFIQDLDVPYSKKILQFAGVKGISLHLAGVNTSLSNEENRKLLIENINYLKEQFSDAEFVSLENADGNPFMKNNDFGICMEPEFISEIIYETGVDFLLDISHAYGSARRIGMDFERYIEKLPLDKIYEIHINGWIEVENDIMSHTKINEIGYQTLREILGKYTPTIVTLEYGRDIDRLNCGIPLILPDRISPKAKEEIEVQMKQLEQILNR